MGRGLFPGGGAARKRPAAEGGVRRGFGKGWRSPAGGRWRSCPLVIRGPQIAPFREASGGRRVARRPQRARRPQTAPPGEAPGRLFLLSRFPHSPIDRFEKRQAARHWHKNRKLRPPRKRHVMPDGSSVASVGPRSVASVSKKTRADMKRAHRRTDGSKMLPLLWLGRIFSVSPAFHILPSTVSRSVRRRVIGIKTETSRHLGSATRCRTGAPWPPWARAPWPPCPKKHALI